MAQALGTVGIVFVYDEGVAIIAVEAFSGGKPHEAPVILQNGNNVVLSETIRAGEVGEFEVSRSRIATMSIGLRAEAGFRCR